MPIYEYQCQKCGHRLEAMQRMSAAPLTRCPECRGKLKKLISAPAFQFKGSGWYVTDYAGKKGGEKKADGDGKAAAEGKSEATGESKPGGAEGKGSDAPAAQEAPAAREPAKKAASS